MNTKIILNKIKFTKIFAPPIQLNRRKINFGQDRPSTNRTGHFQCLGKMQTKAYRLGCPRKVSSQEQEIKGDQRQGSHTEGTNNSYLTDHYHPT